MSIRSGFQRRRKKLREVLLRGFQFSQLGRRRLRRPQWLQTLTRKMKRGPSPRQYLRRDIHPNQFRNPQKKGSRLVLGVSRNLRRYRHYVSLATLLFVAVVWVSVLFGSSSLYLSKIVIEGNKEIETEALEQLMTEYMDSRSLLLIKHSHRLFFRPSKLEERINARYGLEELSFDLHWPSKRVAVYLKEKTSVLAYAVDNAYFTIDKQGSIVRPLDGIESIDVSQDIPLIYDYTGDLPPVVSQQILAPAAIEAILNLYIELKKYPAFSVHSFRIKESLQRAIAFDKDVPNPSGSQRISGSPDQELEAAIDSIAQARTTNEKVSLLREAFADLNVERLEEGRVDELLREEKRFEPNPEYSYQELEVYTKEGWSIKFGHDVLEDPAFVAEYLKYFATLNSQIDLASEVGEYVDLRFSGRIYYR